MILIEGDAEALRGRAWNIGAAIQDLLWFLEHVENGIDIEAYPRTLYQGTLQQNGRTWNEGEQAEQTKVAERRPKTDGEERPGDMTEATHAQGNKTGTAR
jgi:hypothetical protein